ncbi:MAG: hypothetical protein HUU54_05630 [Ignavibacteriaceae bacterium]|nr:hypothetical protein [Ignavibacteriaceae bacterium]
MKLFDMNSIKALQTQIKPELLFKVGWRGHQYVLAGYPHLRAFLTFDGYNIETEPDININTEEIYFDHKENIPLGDSIFQDAVACPEFFALIPPDIRDIVKIFSDSHWKILSAISNIPRFRELIESNSAIAYLLVHIEEFNPSFKLYHDFFYIDLLLPRRQREILGLAGFPASDQAINITRKIAADAINIRNLKTLRAILARESRTGLVKILSHSPVITSRMLQLFARPEVLDIISPNYIKALLNDNKFSLYLNSLSDIARRGKQFGVKFKFTRFEELPQTLIKANEKIEKARLDEEKFPLPPIPGNEYIIPLKNFREQRSWARTQNNCIGGTVKFKLVKKGKSYFYKILYKGESATFEVRIREKSLVAGDLLGFKNKPVTSDLRKYVLEWFDSGKKGRVFDCGKSLK